MSGWIKVSSTEEVPIGEWLVIMADGKKGLCEVHKAAKGTIAVINRLFYFDCEPVIAYHELPTYEEEINND